MITLFFSRLLAFSRELVCLSLLLFTVHVSVGQGVQTAQVTPQGVGYLEYLPPDYATNTTRTYPLIIFLHGAGEIGSGSAADLEKLKVAGPPKEIKNGSTMCFTVNGVQECFIVISPQLWSGPGGWWASILDPFFNEILHGTKNYRIDPTRVYLTGLSMGGQGTYIGLGQTTDIFAAGAVISGFDNGSGCTISSRKIPVWGFHGTADTTIPYSTGLGNFNAIVNCTNPVPTAELKWTSYAGVGHNAWDNAYTTDHSVQSPVNLYEWFLTKKKGTANIAPVASAGDNATVILPANSVTLKGSGSDADGTIVSYQWQEVSGPSSPTIANANTASVSISNMVAGVYTMKLTVTDNLSASASANVNVTVASNSLPVTNAGADQVVQLPTTTLTLAGTATDSDGTIASYAWTKVSGPAATLTNASTANLSLSALVSGTYVFRLTATDNLGGTSSDDATVVVNAAPIANAGADQVVQLPTTTLTLAGTATDSDGTIASYAWTKVSGPAATLTNASTANLSLSALVSGTYVFRLTATDNLGGTSSDDATVIVNAAPVANAGADQVVQLPTTTLTLTGTATDADGTIASYAWTKVSGPSVTLTNLNTLSLSLSTLVAGTYVFRLTVIDNWGGTASDDVTVTVNAIVSAPAPNSNIALQKPVTTSSTETWLGALSLGPNAVDGNLTTRWSSAFSPTEWIAVDLGSNYDISKIKIFWESSYGVSYTVDYSLDGTNWTTIKTVTGNTSVNNELTDIVGTTRFVRIVGLVRAVGWGGQQYGYSIYELEVYGTLNSSSSARTASTVSTTADEVESDSAPAQNSEEETFHFLDKIYTGGKQYTVIILNSSGNQLYSGKWSDDVYKEVLKHEELYIYHIIRDGQRIDSGKMIVTN